MSAGRALDVCNLLVKSRVRKFLPMRLSNLILSGSYLDRISFCSQVARLGGVEILRSSSVKTKHLSIVFISPGSYTLSFILALLDFTDRVTWYTWSIIKAHLCPQCARRNPVMLYQSRLQPKVMRNLLPCLILLSLWIVGALGMSEKESKELRYLRSITERLLKQMLIEAGWRLSICSIMDTTTT